MQFGDNDMLGKSAQQALIEGQLMINNLIEIEREMVVKGDLK